MEENIDNPCENIKIPNKNPLRLSTEQEELWLCAQAEAGIVWVSGRDCLEKLEK